MMKPILAVASTVYLIATSQSLAADPITIITDGRVDLPCHELLIDVTRADGSKLMDAQAAFSVNGVGTGFMDIYKGDKMPPYQICSNGSVKLRIDALNKDPKHFVYGRVEMEGEITGPLTFTFVTDK